MAFLDSDMLCVGPLRGLDELPRLGAAPDHGLEPARSRDGRLLFNTGFFTFVSDPALAQAVEHFYGEAAEEFELGDQMVLNAFFGNRPEGMELIDPSWNTTTTSLLRREARALEDVRLLHYVDRKPWQNMWIPCAGGTPRMVDFYGLWWESYRRSPLATAEPLRQPPMWAISAAHSRPVSHAWVAARSVRDRLWRRASSGFRSQGGAGPSFGAG
jgi:hypothetical protein